MYVSQFIGIEKSAKFIVIACNTLFHYVQAKTKTTIRSHHTNQNKENMGVNKKVLLKSCAVGGPLGFDDPVIVQSTVECLLILWHSIQKILKKEENKKSYQEFQNRLGTYVPTLLTYYKETETWPYLLNLAHDIPRDKIPDYTNACISKLKEFPDSLQPADFRIHLSYCCSQKKSGEILKLITGWIKSGITALECHTPSKVKRPGNEHSKKNMKPKPYLGIRFLEAMVSDHTCQAFIFENDPGKLTEVVENLNIVKDVIRTVKSSLDKEGDAQFLYSNILVALKIAVIFNSKEKMDDDAVMRKTLKWVSDVFLGPDNIGKHSRRGSKRISSSTFGTSEWRSLGESLCKGLLLISRDMSLLGHIKVASDYIQFVKDCLKSDYGPSLVSNASVFIVHLSESGKFLPQDSQTELQKLMPDLFSSFLELFIADDFFSKLSVTTRNEVRVKMREFLKSQYELSYVPKEDVAGLISKLLEAALGGVLPIIEKIDDDTTIGDITSLKTNFIVAVLSGSAVHSQFLEALHTWIKDKDLSSFLAACIVIGQAIPENKSALARLSNTIKRLLTKFDLYLKDFRTKAESEKDKCILKHAESQLEHCKQMLQRYKGPAAYAPAENPL